MTTHLPDSPPPAHPPLIAPPPPLPDEERPAAAQPEQPTYPEAQRTADGGRGLRGLPTRLWRGRPEDPRWVRPAFLGLLAATAVLYLWNLGINGWANSFYSAAVQAGTKSWKAFFFGSSDAGNFITVDKPPMSLWPMEISARILGLSSFSVLLPEALMAVASVGLVYAALRRRFSPLAGLVAGAALALTPVAALMFRFNNPDALLVLLLTLATYAVLRAQEAASTRWLVLSGVFFGFAFLTKTLQAFLILPAFALVYLVTAPTPVWRRVRQLLLAGVAMVVAGGWWVAIVELMPASARPYIGGSQDNSFLSLTFGYNGFGRLTGDETGSVGGGGGRGGNGGGMWGETGITRMFDGDIGGQIAWLLPAALILLVFGLWATRRLPRTDTARAAFLVWGGWLVSTWLVFSYMGGIFHQYYTVALAPAIAALVGMGAEGLWRLRHRIGYAVLLAATTAVTAWWAYDLLGRSSAFLPWLRYVVLLGGLAAAAALLAAGRLHARVAAAAGVAALATALAGPTAYALDTVSTGHTGSIVTAGPAVAGGMGGPGGRGGFPGGGRGGFGGGFRQGQNGQSQNGQSQNGTGGFPGAGGMGGGFPGGGMGGQSQNGTGGFPGGGGGMGRMGGGGGGGMGGLLNGASVSRQMVSLLRQNAGSCTWAAATVGSQNAASYQLAGGEPVMALGGFNGTDPAPSLAQFQQYVKEGKIHYFIAGGLGGGGMGQNGSGTSSQITSWVESHYTARTVGGTTVYDLTQQASKS